MTGAATFNEVFFTEARVAHADLIGRPGDGWAAAVTTLAYERGGRAGALGVTAGPGGSRNELLGRKVGDVIAESRRPRPRANAGALDIRNPGNTGPTSPLSLLAEFGRTDDAVLRHDVTHYYVQTRVNAFNQQRSRAEAAAGKSPGPASSITKLARSVATRMNRDLGPRILGPAGTLAGDDAPHRGAVCQATLQAPSTSIAGGTDEIQHNIIGERVLALPKEPEVDRDLPFRELKVGTQR
jgi:alkylation response protein AidB-like acyl-CoA dehydrogenase